MTTTTLYNIVQSKLIQQGLNEFVDSEGRLVFFDEEHQFMTKIMGYDEDIAAIVDWLFNEQQLVQPAHDLHFKQMFFYRFVNRQINRQTIEAFKLQLMSTFLTYRNYINRVYQDVELYLHQTRFSDQTNTQQTKQTTKQVGEQTSKQTSNQQGTQTNNQSSHQTTEGTTTADTRSAHANLPQNAVNLDVNDTVMTRANTNDINRNKQTNEQDVDSLTEGTTSNQNDSVTDMQGNQVTDGESDSLTDGETFGIHRTFMLDEMIKSNGLFEKIMQTFDKKCFLQVW